MEDDSLLIMFTAPFPPQDVSVTLPTIIWQWLRGSFDRFSKSEKIKEVSTLTPALFDKIVTQIDTLASDSEFGDLVVDANVVPLLLHLLDIAAQETAPQVLRPFSTQLVRDARSKLYSSLLVQTEPKNDEPSPDVVSGDALDAAVFFDEVEDFVKSVSEIGASLDMRLDVHGVRKRWIVGEPVPNFDDADHEIALISTSL
jgi:hypothetical protein